MKKKITQRPDVFFTWDIHYECRFNCTYCFLHQEHETTSIRTRYLPAEQWIKIWADVNARYGKAHMSITGGEPFDYPGFMDLIAALQDQNTLEFSTNFSWDVNEFAARIDPSRVRINPSFHPEADNIDDFIRRFLFLRERDYDMGVTTIVGYPPFLKDIVTFRKKLADASIGVVIFPYRGVLNGQKYPEAYSAEERVLMRELGVDNLPGVQEINERLAERHDISDQPKESRQNMICNMGRKYAKIVPDGSVFRCCAAVWTPQKTWTSWGGLGNIIDGTFKFHESAEPCRTPLPGDCVCFKAMLEGRQDGWQKYWNGLYRPAEEGKE